MSNTTRSQLARFLCFTAAVMLFALTSTGSMSAQEEQTKEASAEREKALQKIRDERAASFKNVFKLKVSAGKYDRVNETVIAPIWFKGINAYPIEMVDEQGNKIYGDLGSVQGRKFMEMAKALKNPLDARHLKAVSYTHLTLPTKA